MAKSEFVIALERELQKAYITRHARTRQLKLPSFMGFHEHGNAILIRVGKKGTIANMQSDEAAFEGWALALHVWLEKDIILEWETPEDLTVDQSRHYERFLYRVRRFHDLFGAGTGLEASWLLVPAIADAAKCRAFTEPFRYVNVTGERPDAEASEQTNREAFAEAVFQRLLRRGGPPFDLTYVDRQLPVGLFANDPLREKGAIFTGKKSAIDLVGANSDQVTVIELKAGDNLAVGKISELLFYIQFIKDTVGPDPLFRFASTKTISPIKAALMACNSLKAVLLVEDMHPLLHHPGYRTLLDEAFARKSMPVTFEAWIYDGLDKTKSVEWNVDALTLAEVKEWR